MTEQDNHKGKILAALERLKWLTVILFALLVLVTTLIFVVRSIDLHRVDEAATRNQAALCTLRADIKERILIEKGRLEERSGGRRAQLRDKIQRQRETISALRVIDCRDIELRLEGIGGG